MSMTCDAKIAVESYVDTCHMHGLERATERVKLDLHIWIVPGADSSKGQRPTRSGLPHMGANGDDVPGAHQVRRAGSWICFIWT